MSVLNFFKNIMTIPEEEDYIEEAMEEEFAEAPKKRVIETETSAPAKRETFASRVSSKSSKTVPFNPSQMQVVIFKPDRFEEVKEIADELNAKKTVILNLEASSPGASASWVRTVLNDSWSIPMQASSLSSKASRWVWTWDTEHLCSTS
ncbi:MAG: cell division protein SepF, partial [Clostridia bacterium]|nr:cell division protein SepF [Clostridia bacterium]